MDLNQGSGTCLYQNQGFDLTQKPTRGS